MMLVNSSKNGVLDFGVPVRSFKSGVLDDIFCAATPFVFPYSLMVEL